MKGKSVRTEGLTEHPHEVTLKLLFQKEACLYLVFLAPLPDAWSLHAKESKWVLANDD